MKIPDNRRRKIQVIHSGLSMILSGILINHLLSQTVLNLKIPLFLDSLGTILTTVLSGVVPGMVVGFLANLIGGIKDPITLYYGIISVLLALAVGHMADRGLFDSWKKAWTPICVLTLIGGGLGSCLTWLLYGQDIGSGISAPYTRQLLDLGMSPFFAQLAADLVIDFLDKVVVVLLAIGILRILPESWLQYLPFRMTRRNSEDTIRNYRRFSLRTKVILILTANSLLLEGVNVAVDTVVYRNGQIDRYTDSVSKIVDWVQVNNAVLIFIIRHIALLLGVALVVAMLVFVFCDLQIVTPINGMTAIADLFSSNDEKKKKTAQQMLQDLDVHSGDELECLFLSLKKTVSNTNAYIDRIREDMRYVNQLQDGMILSFADMVENRDLDTGEHIKHTAIYTQIIAESLLCRGSFPGILTESYVAEIVRSAPLHDIGKICISDTILNKPGKFTPEEFAQMKTHTTAGRDILLRISENIQDREHLATAIQMAYGHHEWWNGNGYPCGRKGEEIPLCARIMAVADVYDALISRRSYKAAFPQEKAFEIIREESGTHFDPVVVDSFLEAKDKILAVE